MTLRNCLACVSIGLALAGCAAQPVADNAQAEVDRQILEASQKILSSQTALYKAGALNQPVLAQPATVSNDQQRITLSWQGDALQLLDKLAHDRGQAFSVIGLRMPLPVNIEVSGAPYDSVMDMLRAQIGYRAEISQSAEKLVLQYNAPKS
jgi:defect-in-organelle-trafficking protein DotD